MSEIPVPDSLPSGLSRDLSGLWNNHPANKRGSGGAPFSLFYAAYCAGYREGANALALALESQIDAGFSPEEIKRVISQALV
jgi:hypothetical protein